MSKMDEIFKRVLNDRDIFCMKKEVFSATKWKKLKTLKNNREDFTKIVDSKIEVLKKEVKDIQKAIKLCETLKSAIEEKPNILHQKLDILKSYGVVKSNLPNMDDYGEVIERYERSTVEQFFLDKIKREKDKHKKRALIKVLEYVQELYNSNQPVAFWVRTLDALSIFWEV